MPVRAPPRSAPCTPPSISTRLSRARPTDDRPTRHQSPGVRHDHSGASPSGAALRALFDARRGAPHGPFLSGVWRYREMVLPTAGDDVVTYPEGNTPLLQRPAVTAWASGRGGGTELL